MRLSVAAALVAIWGGVFLVAAGHSTASQAKPGTILVIQTRSTNNPEVRVEVHQQGPATVRGSTGAARAMALDGAQSTRFHKAVAAAEPLEALPAAHCAKEHLLRDIVIRGGERPAVARPELFQPVRPTRGGVRGGSEEDRADGQGRGSRSAMKTGLKGRVALVSGASQGLGRATAFAFAAEGCDLALCARNEEALDRLASEIRAQSGVKVYTAPVDMREAEILSQFVRNAIEGLGGVDICVANTGGPPARNFLDASDEEWSSTFDLNLRSAVTLARAVIPGMRQRRWGRFVTISSLTVRQPLPSLALSNVIRPGVMGLVRTLSNEFGRDGITANNVGPGYTATQRLLEVGRRAAESTGRSQQQVEEDWVKDIPIGRLTQPEEVADAVVFLASDRAAAITGQTILVDGGMYKGL